MGFGFQQFFPNLILWDTNMTIDKLTKELKDRLFEAEVTLEFFEKKNKADVLIEEQKRSIDGIKEFIEYLETL